MEVTKSPKYSIMRAGVAQKFKRQRAKKKQCGSADLVAIWCFNHKTIVWRLAA
jgi:hypothetical protein